MANEHRFDVEEYLEFLEEQKKTSESLLAHARMNEDYTRAKEAQLDIGWLTWIIEDMRHVVKTGCHL